MNIRFSKTVVGVVENAIPPADMNTLVLVGDVNGDGLPDIVVAGRQGRMVWLENPGLSGALSGAWRQHFIAEVDKNECGGCMADLNGDGRLDIINGSDSRFDEIYWWENPGNDQPWKRRLIAKTGNGQFHDTLIGDVTNDGVRSLVFTNQHNGTTIYRVPLPADPTQEPWPGLEVITTGKAEPNPSRKEGVQPEEGLAMGDVDGDGANEIVCGVHWYKYRNGGWHAHRFARGYITTKCAVADVDGDGRDEILLSEGDPLVYGKREGGKAAWFKPGAHIHDLWEEHVIAEGLHDGHTLIVHDFDGDGHLDVLLGEIGAVDGWPSRRYVRPPELALFVNDGRGNFTKQVIDYGGIHEGVLADMRGIGQLDIVGKPLHDDERWNVHVYYRE